MILLFTIFELIKRPVFWVLYPVAYSLRHWCRTYRKRIDLFYTDRIFTAPDNPIKWFFWLMLDDSIKMEFDLEYCPTAKKMSAWVEKLPKGKFKEFARSYYWSAWRNNGINLSWMLCFGEWTQKIFHYGGGFTYYRLLRYGKWALPQLQYTGLYRFQAGWLTNGKFEIGLTRYNV